MLLLIGNEKQNNTLQKHILQKEKFRKEIHALSCSILTPVIELALITGIS